MHAQLLRYESLIDGTVDLADVALLCDSLAVRAENTELIRLSLEKQRNG